MRTSKPFAFRGASSTAVVVASAISLLSCSGQASKRETRDSKTLGTNLASETPLLWRTLDSLSAPSPRAQHMTLTNGSLVAIFGGYSDNADGDSVTLSDGGIFHPDTQNWSQFSSPSVAGAPLDDFVWSPQTNGILTNNKLIVWNGYIPNGTPLGASLNLSTNVWSNILATNAPSARQWQQSFLLGTKWLVWGGGALCELLDGSMLDTGTLAWTAMAAAPAGVSSGCNNAVPVGTKLFVWGGNSQGVDFATGAIFDSEANTWTQISTASAPSARRDFTLQVSGNRVFVIGGVSGEGTDLERHTDAYVYSVSSGTWSALPLQDNWQSAKLFSATNSAGDLFLFGHSFFGSLIDTGFFYSASNNEWERITNAGAPAARFFDTAPTATTQGFAVWGGRTSDTNCTNNGTMFNPATQKWNPIPEANAPTARRQHSQVWTSTGLFIWGGCECKKEKPANDEDEIVISTLRQSCFRNDGAILNL